MQRLEVISRFFLALASSLFLFLGGLALPPLGIVLFPFVVQPVVVFGINYGIAGGIGILFIAMLVLAIFAGEELAFIYGIFALAAGLLLKLLGRLKAIEHLVVGIAAALFAATGLLLLRFFGSWSAMMQEFRSSISQQIDSAIGMHEKMGWPSESLQTLKEQSPQVIDTMLQILPALLFMGLAFMVLANVLLICRRFPMRRDEWLSLPNLREWKAPEPLVWGLIACGFSLFVPGLEGTRVAAMNLLLVLAACYFAQGLAVIAFFFHKNNVPRFLRGITYILIVFQQIFTLLVVGLGLFDLWANFRRLGKDHLNPSQAA
ncbi:MAG TPA: DUF2232 domain-containing protein [Candidatus Limnocylindria bacterium]|nr:DUF2232 domain-containing protein [Candidatus Limnocylindria bacterium]